MPTPVRQLRISDPHLGAPVDVPIPWDHLPSGYRQDLDALDADDDGIVTYTPGIGGPASGQAIEAHHADDSATRLRRVLWGLAHTYASNSRTGDRATLNDRLRQVRSLQDGIYDQFVLPILGDRTDLSRWRLALRTLSETGDYRHLYRLAVLARAQGASGGTEFLRLAEEALMTAKRFAAAVRSARTRDLNAIETELSVVQTALDRTDRADFRRDAQYPYLLAAMGSPITAEISELQTEAGAVTFGVAVPQSFVDTHSGDLNRAVTSFFNDRSQVFVRGSVFRDAADGAEHRLTAVSAERDLAGSADDPIGAVSSFHLDHGRLDRTVFRGHRMAYFRVRFRLADPSEVLDSREIRKFDLVIRREGSSRTVNGAFVLQNMAGRTSRDVFAADVHVSERDYEIVRVMRESLLSLANLYEGQRMLPDQIPILRDRADEVERFYESVNERAEAAVAQWNDDYRNGRIHRVFLAGDLVDFVNIARTLRRVNYRGSNVRRFVDIFSRLEAPLFVVSGNHDHHGQAFPLSLHIRNFINATELRDLYGMHYDEHRFPDSVLYVEGVKGLLPTESSNDGWLIDVLAELYAEAPFRRTNDDFLDHHMRELGTYETYGVGLGNGFRVFAWPTETEHFNYARYLLEEVHDPVAPGVIDGIVQYLGRQHVNGKGPRPETFVAFLREMEAARREGQRLVLIGHYPAFHAGQGPDQTPDSTDTLRGDAAWAVRLASWYYERPNGEAVMPLSVAGHVHHYAESDFTFHFADASERGQFRRELGAILRRKGAATIFDELHDLRHEWDLDNRIEIRRVTEAGSNGLPGPIMADFNRDSSSYCRRRGTAFINLPTVGVPTDDGGGYVILTTHPNGRVEVDPRFLRVTFDGRLLAAGGADLQAFRRGRWEEDRRWDRSRTMPDFSAPTGRTRVDVSGPTPLGGQPHWDFFPLVYQYPRGKIALTLDGGVAWDFRRGQPGGIIGGQILFPLTHDIHTVLGGPNYLALGAEYSSLSEDLRVRAGLDWGVLTTYAVVDRVTSGQPFLGGEALVHAIFPHAGVSVWGGSTFQGDWGVGMNLRLTLPLFTYRISSASHPRD